MAKSEQLQLRVSAEQKARIKARAAAAGDDVSKWVLRRLLPPSVDRFQRLVDTLGAQRAQRSFALAAMHDFLVDTSALDLEEAVQDPDLSALGRFEANYLAAMVEHVCVVRGLRLPGWLSEVEPMDEPWFASALSGLRLHLLTASPAAFRRRNLFVDSVVGDRV